MGRGGQIRRPAARVARRDRHPLAPRPQLSKPRDRYVYYPDCAEVPESVTPNIRNRSYAIAVDVKIESPDASGVLFSQGSRFGGHALYMKSGS